MIQTQLTFDEFREMICVRLREVREAEPELQERLARRAWTMSRNGVPWPVVLACTRSGCMLAFEMLETTPEVVSNDLPPANESALPVSSEQHNLSEAASAETAAPMLNAMEAIEADGVDGDEASAPTEDLIEKLDEDEAGSAPGHSAYVMGHVDPQDLAREAPLPLRREVGRYERERLSSATRQAIRMAHHAKRWHEIRKMRNVLMGIDQAYLKRMLGDESEALSQEINALLRSWAPLVRERQGRPMRRRR